MKQIFYSLMLVAFFLLGSGCTSLVVGTGGNTGSNDSRTTEQIRSDASITNKINRAYVKDKTIPAVDIKVSTVRGVVTLKGKVSDWKIESRAVYIARMIAGVKKVRSGLHVSKRY